MTEPAYPSQSAWETQENSEFQGLIKEMGSLGNAQKEYLFVATILLYFMSQYFNGETEWPSYAMDNISNVDLYDMQYVSNSFNKVYTASVEGVNLNDDPESNEEGVEVVKQAYDAANNLLVDVYTNPIFQGTQLPDEVLSNLETIFGGKDTYQLGTKTVTYTIEGPDGQKTTEKKDVPYFKYGEDDNNIKDTLYSWSYGETLVPGEPGLQTWTAQMQQIQSELQNTMTLFTDMSSSAQSEENFYYSNLKEFLGTMHGDLQDIASVQKTANQNAGKGR